MSTTEYYRRLGFPTTMLGLSHRSWTRTQIRSILDHYNWKNRVTAHTKPELMHELDLLVQEYDLNIKDRIEIFNAHNRGDSLPRPKPRVRRVPHPTFPDRKAAARREIARNRARTGTISHSAVAAPNRTALAKPSPNIASAMPVDCVVCLETLNAQNIPKRKITFTCNHEPDVCKSCLTTSISTQLDSKVWDQIDCPSCGQRLDFRDVKAFADPVVFARYDNHSLQSCLSGGQFQRCRHPNCQSGQQCFPDEDSYMICVVCGGRTCITCDTIWHPAETCADVAAKRVEARGAEEVAATQYLTTNVKLCPRCNIRGEKVPNVVTSTVGSAWWIMLRYAVMVILYIETIAAITVTTYLLFLMMKNRSHLEPSPPHR